MNTVFNALLQGKKEIHRELKRDLVSVIGGNISRVILKLLFMYVYVKSRLKLICKYNNITTVKDFHGK